MVISFGREAEPSKRRSLGRAIVLAAFIFCLVGMNGCSEKKRKRRPHKFPDGSYVIHRMDRRRGMVLMSARGTRDLYWKSGYLIRFPNSSMKTNTHLFSPDGDVKITPYATVWCREFELEVDSNKNKQHSSAANKDTVLTNQVLK